MAEQGVADNPILITPRTLVSIIGVITVTAVVSYIWIFSTFVTVVTFDAHAMDFERYVIGQDVRVLQASVIDAKDKLWELEQKMQQPGGDTRPNRERKHDLEERIELDSKTIKCLQDGKDHCFTRRGN